MKYPSITSTSLPSKSASPRTIHWLPAIFFLCSLSTTASCWGQDSIHVAARTELGIRSDQMGYSKNNTTQSSGYVHSQSIHRSRFEFYGLRLGSDNNLIRFTLGYQREHSNYRRDWTNSTGPQVLEDNSTVQNRITTSIALGHQFAPFKGEFSSRIFFRAGLSLSHSYVLGTEEVSKRTTMDSIGASPRINIVLSRSAGEQHLQFRAFAQAGVRLWKGLALSLEWQMGPGIQFGILHMSRIQSTFQQNQPTAVNIVDHIVLIAPKWDRENRMPSPFLALSWRF